MNVEPVAFEDRGAGRRGVLALYGDVSPSKDSLVNADRIGFPTQLVLTVTGIVVALVIGYYTGQAQWREEMSGLRSDVRDGFTMLQGDRKADTIRMDVIRRDLDDVMKSIKLHDIQIQQDHDKLILLQKGVK